MARGAFMNIDKLRAWHIAGFFFTVIIGSLLHFAYEWSGDSFAVGLVGAVNESTWEHVKLLIVPMLIFTLIEYIFYGRRAICFLPTRLLSILLGMLVIISVFYTYTGVLGTNYIVVDIILFFVAVYLSFRYSFLRLSSGETCSYFADLLAAFGLILLAAAVVILTLNPPEIPLFQDPLTGTYGIIR